MTKAKSYREQLLHPNWQRRRLEVLQAADFQCELCGDKDSTLHVHHKHYVKGREVWQYENRELQVLCDTCHSEHHETHKLLAEVMALADFWDPTRTALGLVAGYLDAAYSIDTDLADKARKISGATFDIGVAAYVLATANISEVAAALRALTANEVMDPVRENLLHRLQSRATSAGEGEVE